jgi:hypothetical protein
MKSNMTPQLYKLLAQAAGLLQIRHYRRVVVDTHDGAMKCSRDAIDVVLKPVLSAKYQQCIVFPE